MRTHPQLHGLSTGRPAQFGAEDEGLAPTGLPLEQLAKATQVVSSGYNAPILDIGF